MATKMTKLEIGKLAPEALAALKKEHGEIQTVKIKVSADETSFGYLKEPDRDLIAHCLTLTAQKKTLQCGEAILDTCMVAGDPRLKDKNVKNKIRISAAVAANGLIDFYESELGNSLEPAEQ